MKIEFVAASTDAGPKAAIVVLAQEGAPLAGAASDLDAVTGGALSRAVEGSRFTGAKGQRLDLLAPHNLEACRVALVGTGRAGPLTAAALELAGAEAYQALKTAGAEVMILKLPSISPELAAAAAFGIRLGAYRFDRYRTTEAAENKPSIKKVRLEVDGPNAFQASPTP